MSDFQGQRIAGLVECVEGARYSAAAGWISLPFGVVGLSERYGGGPMTRENYGAMVRDVDRALAPFCARNDIGASVRRCELQMLGASGTVTTLTGIDLNLPRYDRGAVDGAFLDFGAIHAISDRLRFVQKRQS